MTSARNAATRHAARTVALVVLLAAGPARAEGSDVPLLTLDEATRLALASNRLVKNADLEVEGTEDALAATREKRYPTFSVDLLESRLLTPLEFEFDRGAFGTFPGIGPIPGSDTKLESRNDFSLVAHAAIQQPISQLHKIGLGVRAKEIDRRIASEKARLQRQATIHDVTAAYDDVVQAKAGLAAYEAALAFYEELEIQIGRSVETQTALRADLLDVKAKRSKAAYDALVTRDALASSKEKLNLLLARDVTTAFDVEEPAAADVWTIDEATARRTALERRPEARQARLQEEQAGLGRRLARAEWIPDVSFTVNYLRLFNEQVLPTDVASAGILLSWTPLDWGQKGREIARKETLVRESENGVREAESSILVEVGARYRAWREAGALVEAAEAGREAAAERLRLVESRFHEQAALLKDLLQARASLADAESQAAGARARLASARAELRKAIGEDP